MELHRIHFLPFLEKFNNLGLLACSASTAIVLMTLLLILPKTKWVCLSTATLFAYSGISLITSTGHRHSMIHEMGFDYYLIRCFAYLLPSIVCLVTVMSGARKNRKTGSAKES